MIPLTPVPSPPLSHSNVIINDPLAGSYYVPTPNNIGVMSAESTTASSNSTYCSQEYNYSSTNKVPPQTTLTQTA